MQPYLEMATVTVTEWRKVGLQRMRIKDCTDVSVWPRQITPSGAARS